MKSKYDRHTPGPWVAVVGDDPKLCQPGKGRVLFPHVEIPNECEECSPHNHIVHAGAGEGLNGCDANARLIADAPLLLRQNRELRRALEACLAPLQQEYCRAGEIGHRTQAAEAFVLVKTTLANCPEA